ncbi:HNH endonuclease [Halosimplex halophilum]|uniref:HNH endonuclease n=1 Tax=Halosimplex halophilum TaxID=2559572 RepID=UPI00107FB0EC|nr:HNH endonuclease signature motif containing protein [Halosimplex halophilum]
MRCVVCGEMEELDDAHVKDRSEFAPSEDDRTHNIISLCPTHHRMFDNHIIGICPSKEELIVEEAGGLSVIEPKLSIGHIKEEYVEYHNSRCTPRIRAALGLIPDQEYAKKCGQ